MLNLGGLHVVSATTWPSRRDPGMLAMSDRMVAFDRPYVIQFDVVALVVNSTA